MAAAPRGRTLVTGCGGFIGSHLAERLVDAGHEVLGVDSLAGPHALAAGEANLARLRVEPRFELRELDLASDPLGGLLDGVERVFHLAGRAGVRQSFGGFPDYVRDNVTATGRLLEEAARSPLARLVLASSSSVYGEASGRATRESAPPRPISPYAATKIAAERLALGAWRERGVPAVVLRYFTVYGPRQRPDMAFARFIDAALGGRPIELLGDGRARRDFTFVDDVVDGTLAAAARGRPGRVYNIGGGHPAAIAGAVGLLEQLLERPLEVRRRPAAAGDPRCTSADGARAAVELGFRPGVALADGLAAQVDWALASRRERPGAWVSACTIEAGDGGA